MKRAYYIGIDVGGTKIAAGLMTEAGRILGRIKSSTPKNSSPKKIYLLISDLLWELLDGCDIGKKELAGIGLGIPGIVDTAKGTILRTPNMNLSGANLTKQLKKKFGAPVALGNDANLGILGEKWLGAARKTRTVIGLFLGTGVGAGAILDDTLATGSHGAAAELGHMIIRDNGPKCSCGARGCLEALIGRWAIERDIRKAIAAGKKTVLTKFLKRKSDIIKSRMLRKALDQHDRVVTRVLTDASRQLGVACVSIRHIFDPEMIVLGGGLIEACGDFMLPIVKKTARNDSLFSGLPKCEIAASQLGDDAIILGGVALVKILT